jgi:hypothetical protein
MDRIRRADLQSLLTRRQGPCVSLFMSLHLAGRDAMQDAVQIRCLADQAESSLIDFGMRRPDALRLLEPIRTLPEDNAAWQHRGRALALFAAPDFFRSFHTDGKLEPAVYVTDQFCLRPLVPLVSHAEHFYLLAISQNMAQLYEGNASGLQKVELKSLPQNLAEAIDLEDLERGEQVHSAMRGALGKQAAVFHGQGGKADAIDGNLKEYVQRVARIVDRYLASESAPLVLATVADTLPIWRASSTYQHLEQNFVAGSPDHLAPHQLHAKSWPIVEPSLARHRDLFRQRLQQADGSKVAFGLDTIVPAAISGRIEALFIDCAMSRWGRYDAQKHAVEVHPDRRAGDQDLVELATAETIRHKGEVFPLAANNSTEPAEALLRY